MKKKKEKTFVFYLTSFIMKVLLRLLLGLKIKPDPKVKAWKKSKKPFVVLCAHPSELDSVMLMAACFPRFTRIVAGAQQFQNGVRGWVIRHAGCIPKKQFLPDLNAAREMIATVKKGYVLAMMPEGRISPDGRSCYFDVAIAKLIKKLKVPVAVLKPQGSYFVMSAFNYPQIKFGKVSAEFNALLDENEAASLSEEEIYTRLREGLSYDQSAGLTPAAHYGKKRGPYMLHVSNLFYHCPVCGAFHTVSDDGYTLSCSACGASSKLLRNQTFEPVTGSLATGVLPKNISEWNLEQLELERQRWSDPAYEFVLPVRRLERPLNCHDKPFDEVSTGRLILNRAGLTYKDDKDDLVIEIPQNMLNGISTDYLQPFVVLYQGDVNRRLYYSDVRYGIQLVNSITVLKEIV